MPDMGGAEAGGEMAMLVGFVEMVVGIALAGIMADPLASGVHVAYWVAGLSLKLRLGWVLGVPWKGAGPCAGGLPGAAWAPPCCGCAKTATETARSPAREAAYSFVMEPSLPCKIILLPPCGIAADPALLAHRVGSVFLPLSTDSRLYSIRCVARPRVPVPQATSRTKKKWSL